MIRTHGRNSHRRRRARHALLVALALGVLATPSAARAQSAIIYGSLGNFDISNDTGKVCHGFEIQLDGLTAADVPYFFTAQRYGTPTVTATPTGVAVRWESPFDAASGKWSERTLPHTVPWFPGQCYSWNAGTYQDSGCEHFGVGSTANPAGAISHWLCEDPAQPGVLVRDDPPTAVPLPTYYVQPPAQAGNPPQLVVEVDAPEPAESPELYGDAQWIRIFVQQLPNEVNLGQLMADNPAVVPMDAAQLESNWDVIQDEPAAGGNGKRKRKRNSGNLLPTTRAVVRRIELYAYTGAYDPVTNEALCADGTCTTPGADELGDLVSVQMTAANVQSDSVTVTRTGSGNVDSADRRISCGNKCVAPYDAGTPVVLTAKAASGSQFAGWSGGCAAAGLSTSCTVLARGHVDVGAMFTLVPSGGGGGGAGGGTTSNVTLSVKTSGGKGLITGTPGAISCGKACSASVAKGTSVTLTATPEAGFVFVGWTGACTGNTPTCTASVNATGTAQATFVKR